MYTFFIFTNKKIKERMKIIVNVLYNYEKFSIKIMEI